jgi:hypothetical protein
MPLQRITHTGAAPPTGLASPISSTALSFALTSATGYPTGAGGPFVIDIDAGTPSEEKVLCSSLSGGSITVASGGRGWDGTAPAAHNAGPTNVTHVVSSAETDDANSHIYDTTRDDHTQYVRTDGTRGISGGLTIAGQLNVGGDVVSSGAVQGKLLTATGQAGIAAEARLLGAVFATPPAGSYIGGDFVIDTTGAIWVWTGSWTKVGGAAAGVTQLVAGTGIALSPAGGTGVVTVTSTAGAASLTSVATFVPSDTSLTPGTPAAIASLTLAAGTWLLGAKVTWDMSSGSSASMTAWLSTVAASTSGALATGQGNTTAIGYGTTIGYSHIAALGATTVYLNVQANGATIVKAADTALGIGNATGITAVKIA